MLGTFPNDFSQVATSQGYFPNCQLPNYAISQGATSQVFPSHSAWPPACSSPGVLGPLAHPSRSAWSPIVACGASEGLT